MGTTPWLQSYEPCCWLLRSVTLFLKEDAAELADPVRLARLIKQYSQFISFPIKLYQSTKQPVKVEDVEATKKKREAEAAKAAAEGKPAPEVCFAEATLLLRLGQLRRFGFTEGTGGHQEKAHGRGGGRGRHLK